MRIQSLYVKVLLISAVLLAITSCQLAAIFTQPHQATRVDPGEWNKLQIGMSKEQVIALLGESPCQRRRTVKDPTQEKSVSVESEFWEYNFCSSLLAGPSPKAYVIYFNAEGKVSSLRAPVE